jgi:hypothetical protein
MLQAGLIEKEVAEAQLKAQQAALEEEKEVRNHCHITPAAAA